MNVLHAESMLSLQLVWNTKCPAHANFNNTQNNFGTFAWLQQTWKIALVDRCFACAVTFLWPLTTVRWNKSVPGRYWEFSGHCKACTSACHISGAIWGHTVSVRKWSMRWLVQSPIVTSGRWCNWSLNYPEPWSERGLLPVTENDVLHQPDFVITWTSVFKFQFLLHLHSVG